MWLKITLISLFSLYIFQFAVLSQDFMSKEAEPDTSQDTEQEDYVKEWSAINKIQPISVGGKIYSITKMSYESTQLEALRYRKERIWDIKKYVYTGFDDNSLKVLYTHSYTTDVEDTMVRYGSGFSPEAQEGRTRTQEISVVLNNKNQGTLEAIDGKKLLITVVDESGRIRVEEKKE